MYPAIKMTDRTNKVAASKTATPAHPFKIRAIPQFHSVCAERIGLLKKKCVYLNVFSQAVLVELFIHSFSDESLLRIMINRSCFFFATILKT